MRINLKHVLRTGITPLLILLFLFSGTRVKVFAAGDYKNPAEVNKTINSLKQKAASNLKVHKMATSAGGTEVLMMEIGVETSSNVKKNPAVLVVGNMDGLRPVTTEAALQLAERLIADSKLYQDRTWYILPMGNPDAADRFFRSVKYADSRNVLPHNDDMDDQTDEDPANDLNGDGLITMMRYKAPDGQWLEVSEESGLMRRAEYKEGEKGIYKIITEGIDDDKDGKYNEDGDGGVNINANFPHLFKSFGSESGTWPGSASEVYALFKFAFEHPEICMTFSFGSTNFLLQPPKGGRQGSVDMDKIEIPDNIAEMLGFEKGKKYSMDEIIEKVKPMAPPGMEIDESVVASFLGLGAIVNPMREDLVFYNKISEDYKEYLKDKGFEDDRYDPDAAKDASFELWSYYHLGLPVFSMDLWGVPKLKEEKEESSGLTLDALEEMSSDDFVALGEEKIAMFLKENGVPAQFSADRLIAMVKGGQTNPKQMVGMMKQMPKPETGDKKKGDPKEQAMQAFLKAHEIENGFVPWTAYEHPELGEVEIGGFAPYVFSNPPASLVDSLLDVHLPFVLKLTDYLPELKISKTEVKDKGSGVYQLDLWVENTGFIPFITEMGKRNKQPVPAIISIGGDDMVFLSGKARTPINDLGGKSAKKFTWLVQGNKNTMLSVTLDSKTAGADSKQIKLGE